MSLFSWLERRWGLNGSAIEALPGTLAVLDASGIKYSDRQQLLFVFCYAGQASPTGPSIENPPLVGGFSMESIQRGLHTIDTRWVERRWGLRASNWSRQLNIDRLGGIMRAMLVWWVLVNVAIST